jgi:hypothetical protein
MDRRTFAERSKVYFRHTDPSRYIARSWIRLLVSLLFWVGICIGLVLLGFPNAAFLFILIAVVNVVHVIYRLVRPRRTKSPEEPGWRMDPIGNYRWWNGSTFTDPPPGETPRKIGPEIDW